MMKRPNQFRFQELTDHIEAMIASGQYRVGARIPSIRALCEKFKLSHGTVYRALEDLQARNVIELQHGSGAYVKGTIIDDDRNESTVKRIAVFSEWADPSSYCGHILLGIQRQAATLNLALNINLIDYDKTSYELLENMARANDALLLLGSYDSHVARLPRIRPGVGIDMHHSFGFTSLVGLDPVNAAELAADFFLARGIRRVKVIGFPVPIYRFREEVFIHHWQHCGGEAESFLPLQKYERDVLLDPLYRNITDEMAEPDCGYLFVSGTECNRVLDYYYRSTGKFLTDERCILSIDGKSLLVPDYLPVNTITPDYYEIGSLALHECLRRIDNPGSTPRRIMVNGTLHEITSSREKKGFSR